MPINLELKIKIDSRRFVVEKIKASVFNYVKTIHQKDIYYNVNKGLLKLRIENGNCTLIKYLRKEKVKRWSNYQLLTLTGENPENYLKDIFKIEAVVEKRRELYMYKNTRIHIDNVKGLGNFLELESVVLKSRKESEKEFNEVVRFLELDLSKQIKTSYKNLLEKKLYE
ncbi:MAG: class IV adenylate cyclase [Bacteroidota bacterium]